VLCLTTSIERSVSLRQPDSDALFISWNHPHEPVGSSTIGRWIKQCLISTGVDPAFGAHSIRASAASQTARTGVPIEQILKAASWSAESIFNRFYRRSLPSNDVAQSVLTQSSPHI
jgi:site-specific recombinase XerD